MLNLSILNKFSSTGGYKLADSIVNKLYISIRKGQAVHARIGPLGARQAVRTGFRVINNRRARSARHPNEPKYEMR